MKTISIRQPWAWAILNAGKRIENRERKDGRMPSLCSHRGPLLIHAAKGCTAAEWGDARQWMRERRLVSEFGPDSTGMYSDGCPRLPSLREPERGGIVGVCNVVGHVVPSLDGRPLVHRGAGRGEYDPQPVEDLRWHKAGSYGLVLADVRPLPFAPWAGALGLFEVPEDIAGPLLAGLQ